MWTSLIGFMGSGKSTLTRRLQASTRRPAVFLDDEVATLAGRSIPEIFQDGGETAFRDLELQALRALDPDRNLVVDTGGGIVHTPEACELLRSRGVVLWLDLSWDILLRRLRNTDPESRPLIGRLGWAGVEELYRRRRPLYAGAADFRLRGESIEVDGLARTAMLRSLVWERRRESGRP